MAKATAKIMAACTDETERLSVNDFSGVKSLDASSRFFVFEKLFDFIEVWVLNNDPGKYKDTTHLYGYVNLDKGDTAHPDNARQILNVVKVKPDTSLINVPLKVKLHRLNVSDYPGTGLHHILFKFSVNHQFKNGTKTVTYTQNMDISDNGYSSQQGKTIFLGLLLGDDGIDLGCTTVNISNKDDEEILNMLKTESVTNGLTLLTAADPAIGALAGTAKALTELFCKRNQNYKVQDMGLQLGFDDEGISSGLKQGSYVAVQVKNADKDKFSWDYWVYDHENDRIVSKFENPESKEKDKRVPLKLNYMIFNIVKDKTAAQ